MFWYLFPRFQRHRLKVLCKIVLVCFPRDAFMFEYKTIDMFEVSEKRLKRENTGFSFGAHKIGYRSSPIWRRSKWKKTSHRVFWPNRNTPTWKIYFNCSKKIKIQTRSQKNSTNWVLKELEKEKYIHQNASCWTNHCWKMLVNEKDKFRRIIFFCFITFHNKSYHEDDQTQCLSWDWGQEKGSLHFCPNQDPGDHFLFTFNITSTLW